MCSCLVFTMLSPLITVMVHPWHGSSNILIVACFIAICSFGHAATVVRSFARLCGVSKALHKGLLEAH